MRVPRGECRRSHSDRRFLRALASAVLPILKQEGSRHHGQVLDAGMPVGRESVAGGKLQAHNVRTALPGVAAQYRELHPGIEARRPRNRSGERAVGQHLHVRHWSRCGCRRRQRNGRYRCIERHSPLPVDLVPDGDVVARVGHLTLRRIVRLGVSAVLRRHGRTRDVDLGRRPVQNETGRFYPLSPPRPNSRRSVAGGR